MYKGRKTVANMCRLTCKMDFPNMQFTSTPKKTDYVRDTRSINLINTHEAHNLKNLHTIDK